MKQLVPLNYWIYYYYSISKYIFCMNNKWEKCGFLFWKKKRNLQYIVTLRYLFFITIKTRVLNVWLIYGYINEIWITKIFFVANLKYFGLTIYKSRVSPMVCIMNIFNHWIESNAFYFFIIKERIVLFILTFFLWILRYVF